MALLLQNILLVYCFQTFRAVRNALRLDFFSQGFVGHIFARYPRNYHRRDPKSPRTANYRALQSYDQYCDDIVGNEGVRIFFMTCCWHFNTQPAIECCGMICVDSCLVLQRPSTKRFDLSTCYASDFCP